MGKTPGDTSDVNWGTWLRWTVGTLITLALFGLTVLNVVVRSEQRIEDRIDAEIAHLKMEVTADHEREVDMLESRINALEEIHLKDQ